MLQTVSLVAERINPRLRVSGVLLCMFERITRLANEVVVDLHEFFQAVRDQASPWSDAKVFETVIRRNIKLAEAPSHGLSIFDYDASSNGAKDYESLAEEFIDSAEGVTESDAPASVETIEASGETPLADAAEAAPPSLPAPPTAGQPEAPSGP